MLSLSFAWAREGKPASIKKDEDLSCTKRNRDKSIPSRSRGPKRGSPGSEEVDSDITNRRSVVDGNNTDSKEYDKRTCDAHQKSHVHNLINSTNLKSVPSSHHLYISLL